MSLPEHSPKSPITSSQSYAESVSAYGKSPVGYQWLNLGEKSECGDILANWKEWGTVSSGGYTLSNSDYPHARPLPKLAAPKRPATPKVSAEVQTLLAKSKMLENTIATAQSELKKIKEAIRGLT